MTKALHKPGSTETAATNGRLAEAAHLQAIEGNPLITEEVAMFEMFEREGWPPERRRAHILSRIKDRGRTELAEKEQAEIDIIERFLPEQLSDADMAGAVQGVIDELGAGSIKEKGRVMGALKEKYAGRMDFGKASGIVKDKLG